MWSCYRQKYKTATEINLFVSDINSPLPYYGPKFNLHHQRKMSVGKYNGCANSEIGYYCRSYLTQLILRRPLHEARYGNWPIWNWKKLYRLLVKFIYSFTCFYRGRFQISYFDRFEIQNLIWVALRTFVVQVCACKHENW